MESTPLVLARQLKPGSKDQQSSAAALKGWAQHPPLRAPAHEAVLKFVTWWLGTSITTLSVVLGVGPRPPEPVNSQRSQRIGCPLTVLWRVPRTCFSTCHSKQSGIVPFTLSYPIGLGQGWSGLHGAGWETEKRIGGMNADSGEKSWLRETEVRDVEPHTLSATLLLFSLLP